MSARVPVTVRWSGVVPQRMTATGVSGDRPPAISLSTVSGSVFTPISSTRVSTAVASRSQSMAGSLLSGSSWPVTTAKVAARPRWLTGMPA